MKRIEDIKTLIRKILKIENIGIRTYMFRKKREMYKKIYKKKYSADDIIRILKRIRNKRRR